MKSIIINKINGEVSNYLPALESLLATMKNGNYVLSVKKIVKHRTLSQNRLFWLWINCISEETGNEKDDLHDYFCNKYLTKKEVFGEKIVSTTKGLDTKLFKEFLDKVQMFAAMELGITLPNPEDRNFEYFLEQYK